MGDLAPISPLNISRFSFGAIDSPRSPAQKRPRRSFSQVYPSTSGVPPRNVQSPLTRALVSPVKQRVAKPTAVLDEFFGVYCLISQSPLKHYKNRCYIGYTVDPNRRIRQHNGGAQKGGANKTDNRGPWEMVCIVHGFPNSVSALRFEWAWQNPDKSRRLRALGLKKSPKESPFAFRLRIVCHMLNSEPWNRLALTFRWLQPQFELPFPADVTPPSHMDVQYGLVEKASSIVPNALEDYEMIRPCAICKKTIQTITDLLRCPSLRACGSHFHVRCLAERAISESRESEKCVIPVSARCPRCSKNFRWGDVVRDQRNILTVDANKPMFEDERIAVGMVPRQELDKC
uniref:Structure-specific endonuclease subunit SLX1 homolog n=1 Tax=Steinernema glaseri TaxID=37863 RepID=A0A1I7YY19_9BILA